MADDLTATCPGCGCPGQRVGLNCGFCAAKIPLPNVNADGTAVVKEVIGFRGWAISFDLGRDKPRLKSPTMRGYVWEPGQWMIAECVSHYGLLDPTDWPSAYHGPLAADPAYQSPVKECGGTGGHGCGFYAARDRSHLVGALSVYTHYTADNPSVIGQVQMAGKIIFATNGFRAQRVRPRTIYVPHELWELGRDLKKEYGPHGVVIDMAATVLPESRKWCERCSAAMKPKTLDCDFCGHHH